MEKAEEAVKEAAEVEARRVGRQQAAEKFRIKQKVMNNKDTEAIYQPDPDVFEDAPKQKKIRLSKKEFQQKLSQLKPIIETAERFGLSDSAVAHIVNATNAKSSIISKDNSSEVLY